MYSRDDAPQLDLQVCVLAKFKVYTDRWLPFNIPSFGLFGKGESNHVGPSHSERATYIAKEIAAATDIDSVLRLLQQQKSLFLTYDPNSPSSFIEACLEKNAFRYKFKIANPPSIPTEYATEPMKVEYLRNQSDYFKLIDESIELLDPSYKFVPSSSTVVVILNRPRA